MGALPLTCACQAILRCPPVRPSARPPVRPSAGPLLTRPTRYRSLMVRPKHIARADSQLHNRFSQMLIVLLVVLLTVLLTVLIGEPGVRDVPA
jgi:hypothetical protein